MITGWYSHRSWLLYTVKYDNADNKRPGFKFADYELKGVPVRLVMGGRDLENGTVEVMRRDTLEKETMSVENIEQVVKTLLDEIQANIFQKALKYRQEHTITVDSYDEFKEKIEEGGFILAHWDGTTETEERIKEETNSLYPVRWRYDSGCLHGYRKTFGSSGFVRPFILRVFIW